MKMGIKFPFLPFLGNQLQAMSRMRNRNAKPSFRNTGRLRKPLVIKLEEAGRVREHWKSIRSMKEVKRGFHSNRSLEEIIKYIKYFLSQGALCEI